MAKLSSAIFERKFKRLLDEQAIVLAQLSEVQGRLTEIDSKISAFRIILAECGVESDSAERHDDMSVDEFHGMGLEEALVAIAERHHGELNVYHARPLMIEAGLLKGEPRATSARLYEMLSGSERFEPTGERGRWRLGSDQATSVEEGVSLTPIPTSEPLLTS